MRQDFIDVPAGALAGHWQIERAARDTVDGQQLATKTAPVEAVDNDLPDGTVEHVYLVYTQPQTPETIDPNDAGKVTPATPGNTPGSGAGTATSASVAVSPAAAQLSAADSQNAQGKHLPQTGQANSRGLLALGLTAFLTAIGLGAVNRKRQD
ncbi:LPXTG cell wall anchor domain-containing protein [Limosilactobacillus oris]|uniref:LPXTG cell wall anchor domain-containing protein n=1 Tax=Limosilactobacillus oris TaxID=1632 RepID=UPI003AB441FF